MRQYANYGRQGGQERMLAGPTGIKLTDGRKVCGVKERTIFGRHVGQDRHHHRDINALTPAAGLLPACHSQGTSERINARHLNRLSSISVLVLPSNTVLYCTQ